MNLPFSITPSKLASFERCGVAFFRRYFNNEILPPAIAAAKGTSVHKASELNFKQKITSGVDLKESEIVDSAVSTLEGIVKNEGVWLDEEDRGVGKKKIVGEAVDATARLGKIYAVGVAPKYQPTEVEIDQNIKLASDSYYLRGRLDLIDSNGAIVDLKTTGKTKSQGDIDKSSQLTFYHATYKANKGEDPKKIVIENIVDLKSGPKVVTLETSRTNDDIQVLVNRINTMVKSIEAGVFLPASPDSWACTKKFCGYASSCKFYSGK